MRERDERARSMSVYQRSIGNPVQGSPDNMTPLGIGKNVIQTDCLINWSFLVQEGPLWDKKLSYKAIVILSGEPCSAHFIRQREIHLS